MNTTHKPPPAWAVRTEADRRALAAGYYWDQAAAERVIRFAELYLAPKYTRGEFRLFDWQRRTLMSWYGWRSPDGSRRWRRCLLHIPKKNGKTLLVAIVAAYELLGGVADTPLVMSASTTKKNARQVFEQLVTCFRRQPALKRATRITDSKNLIHDRREAGGKFIATSSDAPDAEGENCSAAIIDEAHAHRSEKLYRAMEYSMIGRDDGFMVVISTAGDDVTHWYHGLVERGRAVLAGEDLDPTFYAEVYEANPDKDELADPAVWKRVNPSLDLYSAFTTEKFRLDYEAAKTRTTDRLSFERYRLNIFRTAAENTWIDLVRWDACKGAVPEPADLKLFPCYLGFDASQRVDPTSIAAVWVRPDRRFYARTWAWVAEAGVREREKTNLPKYQAFIAEGSMVMTPGEVIDKSAVMGKLLELIKIGNVKKLIMDPNGVWVIGQDLDPVLGIDNIHRFKQAPSWFNGPVRELETAVIQKRVTHDGSAWTRWCVNSVRLDEDRYKNVRPVKSKGADHIDGAVALLMAFAMADQAAAAPPPKPSVYETRGFSRL